MNGLDFLPLVGIALLFWLLIVRPASRRAKEQYRMQSALTVGDDVLLTSGFFGRITVLHDDRLEVELAPGTTVSVVRGAIGSVIPPDSDIPEHDPNKTDGGPVRPDAEEN